jgi:hypothetical protein
MRIGTTESAEDEEGKEKERARRKKGFGYEIRKKPFFSGLCDLSASVVKT